jgi:hypothetical protein
MNCKAPHKRWLTRHPATIARMHDHLSTTWQPNLLQQVSGAKALPSLMRQLYITFLLEDIDTNTPAFIRARRALELSPLTLVQSCLGLSTLQPMAFCTHYFLSGARPQRTDLSSSGSFDCFASSYDGL